MTDAEAHIIRLLTEIRDDMRADRDSRRGVIEESLVLQRGAVRAQRLALRVVFLLALAGGAFLIYVGLRGR